MGQDFDEIKANLQAKEHARRLQLEQKRLILLEKAKKVLREEFKDSDVTCYLVGSVTKPGAFTQKSDVDIVLKNFKKDRFDLWTRLEEKLEAKVELILFEKCQFQEFVEKEGLKITDG